MDKVTETVIDALKQALKNETLRLAAEPPVAALLQRRRRAAKRKRRYRARRRDGTYCALIRFAPTMIADLVELGLLPDDQRCGRHEFEVAVSTAIDMLRQTSRPQ